MANLPSKTSLLRNDTGLRGTPTGPTAPPTGQPALPNILPADGVAAGQALAPGGDNIPAQITDHQGAPKGPAAIKQGEVVFSVESIIGAGNGDYNKGLKHILNLHDTLQAHGDALLQEKSLAGAKGGPNEAAPAPLPQAAPPAPEASQGLAAAPI